MIPAAAAAQPAQSITQSIAGTRLDVNATGEVTRVPDVAVISPVALTSSRVPAIDWVMSGQAAQQRPPPEGHAAPSRGDRGLFGGP